MRAQSIRYYISLGLFYGAGLAYGMYSPLSLQALAYKQCAQQIKDDPLIAQQAQQKLPCEVYDRILALISVNNNPDAGLLLAFLNKQNYYRLKDFFIECGACKEDIKHMYNHLMNLSYAASIKNLSLLDHGLITFIILRVLPLRIKILLDAGANINASDGAGPALCKAVLREDVNMVQFLLSYPHLNVNSHGARRVTPLMLAISKQNSGIVKLLLTRPDVSIEMTNIRGEMAIDEAYKTRNREIINMVRVYYYQRIPFSRRLKHDLIRMLCCR